MVKKLLHRARLQSITKQRFTKTTRARWRYSGMAGQPPKVRGTSTSDIFISRTVLIQEIELEYLPTDEMIVDILTKPLQDGNLKFYETGYKSTIKW